MSETPRQYNDDGTPFNQSVSSAERTTLDFVTAINSFHWRQELINYLNQFDSETLTKMIEEGGNK